MRTDARNRSNGMTLIEVLGAIAVTSVIAAIGIMVISAQLQGLLGEANADRQLHACEDFAYRLQLALDRRQAHFFSAEACLEVAGLPAGEGTWLEKLAVTTFDKSGNASRVIWQKRADAWYQVEGRVDAAGVLKERRLELAGDIILNLKPAAYSVDNLPRTLTIRVAGSAPILGEREFAIYLAW